MPTINKDYREIKLEMYYYDTDKHKMPHIHVKYQDKTGVYDIKNLEFIEGNIDKFGKRYVQTWVTKYQKELIEMWNKAVVGVPDSIHIIG